jgi:catechol 2,3-dioxygenase-like lactoylglutathione lyase family enzyme
MADPGDGGGEPGEASPVLAAARRGHTGVEFHVADVEASLAFYQALGFRVAQRWQEWIRLDRDGAQLVLFSDEYVRRKPKRSPHYFGPWIDGYPRGVGVEVVIEVADVDAVHAAAVAAGLRIVKGLEDRPWQARDFRLADPDGYFLRITSPLRHD